jgi:hypothetical protein
MAEPAAGRIAGQLAFDRIESSATWSPSIVLSCAALRRLHGALKSFAATLCGQHEA